MKKIIILILLTSSISLLANAIKITKKATSVQVIEVETKTTCKEIDTFIDDIDFDCNIAQLKKSISTKIGNIIKIEGMDKNSNYVLSNSVDDVGTYNIKVRILYYK